MSDPFDHRLRSGLGGSPVTNADPHGTLIGLRPSLRRARRMQRIKGGVAGLAMVVVSGGALMVIGNGGSAVEQTVVAVSPEVEEKAVEPSAPTTSPSEPTTSVGDSAPTSNVEVPTTDENSPTSATSVATTVPSEPPASTSTPTSPTTTSPTTEGSSSTSSTSTTVAAGQITIESPCGSIVVSMDGDDVALIEVLPQPGFSVDEKSNGPEKVEVSFESPSGHCEIEAEVRGGVLESEISTE